MEQTVLEYYNRLFDESTLKLLNKTQLRDLYCLITGKFPTNALSKNALISLILQLPTKIITFEGHMRNIYRKEQEKGLWDKGALLETQRETKVPVLALIYQFLTDSKPQTSDPELIAKAIVNWNENKRTKLGTVVKGASTEEAETKTPVNSHSLKQISLSPKPTQIMARSDTSSPTGLDSLFTRLSISSPKNEDSPQKYKMGSQSPIKPLHFFLETPDLDFNFIIHLVNELENENQKYNVDRLQNEKIFHIIKSKTIESVEKTEHGSYTLKEKHDHVSVYGVTKIIEMFQRGFSTLPKQGISSEELQRQNLLFSVSSLRYTASWNNSVYVSGSSGNLEQNKHAHHETGMSIFTLLYHLGLTIIGIEIPVASSTLYVKLPNGIVVNPIGVIDIVAIDQFGNLVVVDLKTAISQKTSYFNYKHPKEHHMIQVEFYCLILDYIASQYKSKIIGSYSLIIYWDPRDDGTSHSKGIVKVFKIERKPSVILYHKISSSNILNAIGHHIK